MGLKEDNVRLTKENELLQKQIVDLTQQIAMLTEKVEDQKLTTGNIRKELLLDTVLPKEIDPDSDTKEPFNYYLERYRDTKTSKKDRDRLYCEMRRNIAKQYKAWNPKLRAKDAYLKAEKYLKTLEVVND